MVVPRSRRLRVVARVSRQGRSGSSGGAGACGSRQSHDAQSGLPANPSWSKKRRQSSSRSGVTGWMVTAPIASRRTTSPESRSTASA